jgi:ubiquinone/menaquinone biosynthesis C-methylase UbiE
VTVIKVSKGSIAEVWDEIDNARHYARFARDFSMYRQTSADLVAVLAPEPDATIVDLACGTGATTEEILAGLGPSGRVIAFDGSAPMLAESKKSIDDARVTWVHARAEQIDRVIELPVDAVVCNAAFWQMDVPATIAAIRRLLRPGGRLIFNVTAMCLRADSDVPAPLRTRPSFGEVVRAIAVLHHGWVPPAVGGEFLLPSVRSLKEDLHAAGFSVEVHEASYQQTRAEAREWLSIPIFTEYHLPGMDYKQRMEVVYRAMDHLDHPDSVPPSWVIFSATAVESVRQEGR